MDCNVYLSVGVYSVLNLYRGDNVLPLRHVLRFGCQNLIAIIYGVLLKFVVDLLTIGNAWDNFF